MLVFRSITLLTLSVLLPATLGAEQEKENQEEEAKPPAVIAGKADVLRHVPKKFATLLEVDASQGNVRLHVEGDAEPTTWPVSKDAEIKVHGWWGRLSQIPIGDRVWVWFAINRDKKPVSVWMLADELSEQDIHGQPYEVISVDGDQATVDIPHTEKLDPRSLKIADTLNLPAVGQLAYLQTASGALREAHSSEAFEKLRDTQQQWLREQWHEQGLPGSVSVLHPLGGEMDVLLAHEAMRWARYLEPGAEVSILQDRPIQAVVKEVQPWRERTLLRLVTKSGVDQLDLGVGQPIGLRVPEPPKEIQDSDLPTDIGRLQNKQDRIDWFLASTYCTCGIGGDRCTGMFYIQASCNVNACGMPNQLAREIAALIDAEKSDREIYAELKADRGRDLWQPHLLR